MSLRRWTLSANESLRTRSGRVAVTAAGTSTDEAYSTRSADHGAPPTRRRISTYSIGFGTRSWLMLASSHRDSFSRFRELSANRRRQPADIAGAVRDHRSARPRSVGLTGMGTVARSVGGSTGMNPGSRSRYAF